MNPEAVAPPIHVIVWAMYDSPRLRYVLDWLLTERLGLAYELTGDASAVLHAPTGLAYGWMEGPPSIRNCGLLQGGGPRTEAAVLTEWEGMQALFLDAASPCDIQFDMLSGIFHLLSRSEEYDPFDPDRHGRYPAERSVLFPVLERPVVDEWVESLRQFLEQVWSISIPASPFAYETSYDIDIAWKYRNKGWKRNLGAALKDVLQGRISEARLRMKVVRNRQPDPWDAYVFMFAQHMMDALPPMYFVLSAERTSAFDKNISPGHPGMRSLVKAFASGGRIGLHPSYFSDVQPGRLDAEKALLERAAAAPVHRSRQHFIRVRFPETYRHLLAAGISDDYSMGYGTAFGFRAGTGASFLWYDLGREAVTALRVHPFAFMDTTGHYDMSLSADAAFERLREMTSRLIATNSRLVTVMHNFSLGTDPEWAGWRRGYEAFLNDMRPLHP